MHPQQTIAESSLHGPSTRPLVVNRRFQSVAVSMSPADVQTTIVSPNSTFVVFANRMANSIETSEQTQSVGWGFGLHNSDSEQEWFWSARWQRMESEADADIAAGRVTRYDGVDDLFAGLDR